MSQRNLTTTLVHRKVQVSRSHLVIWSSPALMPRTCLALAVYFEPKAVWEVLAADLSLSPIYPAAQKAVSSQFQLSSGFTADFPLRSISAENMVYLKIVESLFDFHGSSEFVMIKGQKIRQVLIRLASFSLLCYHLFNVAIRLLPSDCFGV